MPLALAPLPLAEIAAWEKKCGAYERARTCSRAFSWPTWASIAVAAGCAAGATGARPCPGADPKSGPGSTSTPRFAGPAMPRISARAARLTPSAVSASISWFRASASSASAREASAPGRRPFVTRTWTDLSKTSRRVTFARAACVICSAASSEKKASPTAVATSSRVNSLSAPATLSPARATFTAARR